MAHHSFKKLRDKMTGRQLAQGEAKAKVMMAKILVAPRRGYFIVKHGLDAFKARPNCIWNTRESETAIPRGYRQIQNGDRWVAYAYTTSDERERPLSLITGFHECTKTASYGPVDCTAWEGNAWTIQGKRFGWKPHDPVIIPPIARLLGRSIFNQATITRVTEKEFQKLHDEARRRELPPQKIPHLGRAPLNEQELLSVVVSCHKKLGIKRILRAQTAFPDLLVELEGSRKEIYLELEIYSASFLSHGHGNQVKNRHFGASKETKRPVAILCWIDDANEFVKGRVHKVYELQGLLREGKKIRW